MSPIKAVLFVVLVLVPVGMFYVIINCCCFKERYFFRLRKSVRRTEEFDRWSVE